MSPGTYTVVTSDDTLTGLATDGLTVKEAIEGTLGANFSWENHTVRLDNQAVSQNQASSLNVSVGQTITVLGSGLANAGIKGN